ncbi:MAG: TetR/AcrR family transcriptional regulator [Candidatus Acidiferrum sp.]
MPPKYNPKTERRILNAAMRLWRIHGEQGLTLRAVAREARTSTPTVYRRFRDKQALRLALAEEFRQQLIEECLSAASLEEIFHRYVRFAERHPNEYRLLWTSWSEVFRPDSPRPIQTWVLSQLANRFGGKPEDYLLSFFGLIFLCHGAAMLLTTPGEDAAHEEVRTKFPLISDAMLQNARLFQ